MERLDKERYLRRVIVVCWIALAICFGIKLFGGNLFEIMCHNENFIKVCIYTDTHFFAYYFLNALNSFILSYFYTLAVCQKLKYEALELFVLIATVLLGVIVKLYSNVMGFVFDIWQMVIMPCIFTLDTPKKHWNVILGNVLVVAFQLISMFVRNIGLKVLTWESSLTIVIFSIDVFIMVILYYLYSNVKGGVKNGRKLGLVSMQRRRGVEGKEGKTVGRGKGNR